MISKENVSIYMYNITVLASNKFQNLNIVYLLYDIIGDYPNTIKKLRRTWNHSHLFFLLPLSFPSILSSFPPSLFYIYFLFCSRWYAYKLRWNRLTKIGKERKEGEERENSWKYSLYFSPLCLTPFSTAQPPITLHPYPSLFFIFFLFSHFLITKAYPFI